VSGLNQLSVKQPLKSNAGSNPALHTNNYGEGSSEIVEEPLQGEGKNGRAGTGVLRRWFDSNPSHRYGRLV